MSFVPGDARRSFRGCAFTLLCEPQWECCFAGGELGRSGARNFL